MAQPLDLDVDLDACTPLLVVFHPLMNPPSPMQHTTPMLFHVISKFEIILSYEPQSLFHFLLHIYVPGDEDF